MSSVLAQEPVCSELPVGSDRWRQCVEDAATGGGLMPWIVIVPLGVMLLGMLFMFRRQFRSQRAGSPAPGVAGWLIFTGLIELSIGLGLLWAELRAPGDFGGFGIAAVALLATSASLLVIGAIAGRRSATRRRIRETGTPGEGRILSMGQTGMTINNNPVIAFDLELNVPGVSGNRTQLREMVPLIWLSRLSPGGLLPVRADRGGGGKVMIDWERLGAQSGGASSE